MLKKLITITSFFLFALVPNLCSGQSSISEQEDLYYKISGVEIPEDIVLGVGGMVFNDQGQLGVCTRRGDVWLIDNPLSSKPNYTRFAKGLHEPLGLNWKDGSFYAAQRGELTKLTDTDKDGFADEYTAICSWPLEGNYHEYSYGPKFTKDGNMLVALNLAWVNKGESLSKWRGWIIEISPEGTISPLATGMRSPAGFGFNAAGDLFYTENQGDWVGSGRMTHVEKGDFVGNPSGLRWSNEPESPVQLTAEDIDDSKGLTLYEYSKELDGIKPPSVWFPHALMGISTSDLVVIPENFGSFAGQLLVGDQGHSKIMRVFQEKINGVYQGICFPFKEGFESGVLRMVWDQDNSLYVGMTSRGWASTGKKMFGLQRLAWTGKSPFEMKTVKAKPDGFEIEFTHPVDKNLAQSITNFGITDFTYHYHEEYGSPVIDQEKKRISKAVILEDGRTVRLYVEELRKGYIYEIKADGIRDLDGAYLLHDFGYYTLNEIPSGDKVAMDHDHHARSVTGDLVSSKRPTAMPADWTNGPDQIITMGTVPGLKFDIEEIIVSVGSKVKLVFNNNDDMLHNLLIVNPGKADLIGNLALKLGLSGQEKGYVPESDDVLYHTNLMQPHTSDAIYFEAPNAPGKYPYVCTFPGHAAIMRGVMIVR